MLWIGIALVVGALVLNVVSVRLRRKGQPAAVADVSSIDDVTRSEIDVLVAEGDTIDPVSLAEIDALIAADNPVAAIKLVRERTGWGLADSKRWVDARTGR